MSDRAKISIVHKGKVHSFNQGAHESLDEVHGRALCAVKMAEGDVYAFFEWENGAVCPHPVYDRCSGTKHIHHMDRPDERIAGFYYLVDGQVKPCGEVLDAALRGLGVAEKLLPSKV